MWRRIRPRVSGASPVQGRQAVQELAGLGRGQGPQGLLGQPALGVGNRVAAGDQDLAHACRPQQGAEHEAGGLVQEARAAQGQVVLEVVQHQQDPVIGEQGLELGEPHLVRQLGIQQQGADLGDPALQQHELGAQGQGQLPESEASHRGAHRPAVLRQAGHDAPGQRALAHPADAADQHPRPAAQPLDHPRVVAQHPGDPAERRPAANELVHPQQGHDPHGGQRGLRGGRFLGQPVVDEGALLRRGEQGRGGVLGDQTRVALAPRQGLAPLLLHLPPGMGQGAAGQGGLAAAQVLVEGPGQAGGVPIRDTGLHGDDERQSLGQQALGEAPRLGAPAVGVAGAAETGGEKDQGRAPSVRAQAGGQLPRGDGDGAAVLVLQLDEARTAVAREVDDMVGTRENRLANLVRVADLQDLDLRIAILASPVDGVEDGRELALVVEHGVPGAVLVRRAECDQDAQGSRQGVHRDRRDAHGTALHQDAGLEGGDAPVRKPGHLEGQGQEIGVGLDLHPEGLSGRGGGVEHGGERGAHRAGQHGLTEDLPQACQVPIPLGRGLLDAHAADAGQGGPQEFAIGAAQGGIKARGLGGPRLAVQLRADLEPVPFRLLQSDMQPPLPSRGAHRAQPRLAAAPVDGVDQALQVLARHPGAGAQQLGHRGIQVQHHRDDRLAVLDGLVGQGADLVADPGLLQGSLGEEDQPHLALRQPLVDAGDDVIAGGDLPGVHPGVDPGRRKPLARPPSPAACPRSCGCRRPGYGSVIAPPFGPRRDPSHPSRGDYRWWPSAPAEEPLLKRTRQPVRPVPCRFGGDAFSSRTATAYPNSSSLSASAPSGRR